MCACKDFIEDDSNEILIPYTALRNDTNPIIMEHRDTSYDSASNLSEILFQLKNNSILGKIKEAEERFWIMAIVDLLINNNDRNEDNWGVIKFKKENEYKLAPIYDCGGCFYGKTAEERVAVMLSNEMRLQSSALNTVTAFENEKGRVSLIRMLTYVKENKPNLLSEVCNNVRCHWNSIEQFFHQIPKDYLDVPILSEQRKKYYIRTMKIRLDYISNIAK